MADNFKLDLPRALAVGIGLCFALIARGAEEKLARQPPDFRRPAPLAAVKKAAETARVSLEGIEAPASHDGLRSGDRVTALVSLTEGKKLLQWVIALEVVEPTDQEKKTAATELRLYTASGYQFDFGSGHAVLAIQVFGPLSESDATSARANAPEVQRRRIQVSADYLALGFDRIPAVVLRERARLKEDSARPQGEFGISTDSFPPETTGASRKAMESIGVTEADERAMAGSLPALISFFEIAASTPGLQEVLMKVLDVPWWSIVKRGGKMPAVGIDMASVNPSVKEYPIAPWGLAEGAKLYSYPFGILLNQKPALLCQLAVTASRPPLLASGGIVGLAAGRPDGKGPVLTLQVVAARTASANSIP